ncbi:MAG: mechanosensitive ion channel [Xenococcaceae cyanobacterium MO_188.B19]|nr:mechanosensitive ion channel [Xenococcaceae cyanobacterium MO_188.B19]
MLPTITILLQAEVGAKVIQIESLLKSIIEILTVFGFKILAAIVVFLVGNWVAKWIRGIIQNFMEKRELEATVTGFVSSLSYYAMITFVVIVALGQLGVRTASFVAIIGAAGLAVGLALQGSLSNFASGVLLVIFRPFKVGDFVEAGGVAGVINSIEIFYTILKSPDNKKIIVPNSNIMAGNIVNYSAFPIRRLDLVFGIGYDDDIDHAKQIIWDVLNQDDRILKEPGATVSLSELADSSVNFAVRPWVNGADYWNVLCDTTETVKKQFDAAGISIPYPQQDVHVYEEKS